MVFNTVHLLCAKGKENGEEGALWTPRQQGGS